MPRRILHFARHESVTVNFFKSKPPVSNRTVALTTGLPSLSAHLSRDAAATFRSFIILTMFEKRNTPSDAWDDMMEGIFTGYIRRNP